MTKTLKYNIFILISTIARNIIEVFSSVFLYKLGYSIKDIMLFYFLLYLISAFTNVISIYLINKINYKYVLVISSLIYSYAFYFLNNMTPNLFSLIIFSILLGLGSYSYHSIRHYMAIKVIDKNKRIDIGNILIFTYIAYMISSYIGAFISNRFGLIYVVIIIFILSILGIIPLITLDNLINREKIKFNNITFNKHKLLFFIFEQFKVIFLILQPLYLYLYVEKNMEYIGLFNIIMGLSSIIFVYFFVRKIKVNKYFWLLNIIFCIILILKLNISNNFIMLMIAFLEGLFSRMYEVVSTENLYDIKNGNVSSYLIIVELIFCFTNSILYLIFYIFNININIIMYICIEGILISGFVRYKNAFKIN